ncbi:MAG: hypothetical protein KA059_01990 [Elusimicrobiales bacterium]|jgi:hypothetical protein|nr:hypothetical protein [Elusimicrobiales bacterium]NLH38918.1 hypothetical protein [Elusimicrobiota bacterium]
MSYKIKIKTREIEINDAELTAVEIKKIEAELEKDFNELNEKNVVDTITQLASVIAKYAVKNYLMNKQNLIDESSIDSELEHIIDVAKQAVQKDMLF